MAELDSQPKSIQSIYSWYSDNKLWVNRRYQRKLVWTLEEKQKLIESVLKGYPIPAILLAERETGDYEVIDGLRRLHTLVSFIETAFPTLDDEFFNVDLFVTAKTRSTEDMAFLVSKGEKLSAREVSKILDYSMAVSVMRGASDAEIDDVFSRINTYGHRLSDQERRQAGVGDDFSTLVRELACEVRGDTSSDILSLSKMPSISIDLPLTKHGYEVQAEEVFWVAQGVLRSTDLRDSMDEQCIADVTASIVGGTVVERSKSILDRIYQPGEVENERIIRCLDGYGIERFAAEFKFCLQEIAAVCGIQPAQKLRSIIFSRTNTNPFPAVFAVLCIAFHEILFSEGKKIADYGAVRNAITNLDRRVETGKASNSPAERRRNVDTIKGLIQPHVIDSEPRDIYGDHTSIDIDNIIRRSEVEAPHYELKQGLLRLGPKREIDPNVIDKVIKTICAIANNGTGRSGTILIGVADKEADVKRIRTLDQVEPRRTGQRFVVGIRREAVVLGETPERYFGRWKEAIRNSGLTESLRDSVLGSLAYAEYYGLGVIVIRVPEQHEVSLLDGRMYVREGDDTVEITDLARSLAIGRRFHAK